MGIVGAEATGVWWGVKRRGDQHRGWRGHCGSDCRKTPLAAWSRVARRVERRGLVASVSRVFSGAPTA